MKKQWLISVLMIISGSLLFACNKQEVKNKTNIHQEVEQNSEETKEGRDERKIRDISGTEVIIPSAKDIKRVVVVTPPVTSMLIKVIPDKNMIVGLNKKAFIQSNELIMGKEFPEYKKIDSSFIGEDFSVNTESLLALKPDIVLYYGEAQKKNLENVGVPAINFFSPELTDPKDVTIAWYELLCEIFEIEKKDILSQEWEYFNALSKKVLENQTPELVKALWVFRNVKGKLMVAGTSSFDSYAQMYFDKSGIVNVANEIQGTAEVNMEKIHEWNPDMVFVFQGVPAGVYLQNKIDGQDWSMLKAFQDKKIYDIPKTTYSWAAPCMDSPLMPLWLISKAYPDKFSSENFNKEFKDYYKRVYNISLTDEEVKSVLEIGENKK